MCVCVCVCFCVARKLCDLDLLQKWWSVNQWGVTWSWLIADSVYRGPNCGTCPDVLHLHSQNVWTWRGTVCVQMIPDIQCVCVCVWVCVCLRVCVCVSNNVRSKVLGLIQTRVWSCLDLLQSLILVYFTDHDLLTGYVRMINQSCVTCVWPGPDLFDSVYLV